MDRNRILVTGASGFIGGYLAKNLSEQGYEVTGTLRRRPTSPVALPFTPVEISLGESLANKQPLKGYGALIHSAFDVSNLGDSKNILGTELWASEAMQAGVPIQIFLSTITAKGSTASSYGREKLELENFFERQNAYILRLGLVVGPGGVFAKIARVSQLPIVPLPGSGEQNIFLIGISDVATVVRRILAGELQPGSYNLFQPQGISLRGLLAQTRDQRRGPAFNLPIPTAPIASALRLWEWLGAPKLPFSVNNLTGLRENSGLQIVSDLERVGLRNLDPSDVVAREWRSP